jgi:DNA adenine methylase
MPMVACRTPTRGAFYFMAANGLVSNFIYMERRLTGIALRLHSFNVPFAWLGSKATMLDTILPNIPEHRHYVEPFCGTAIVYLRKPLAKLNTLNDIDNNIVNFFRVLQDRDKTKELLRRLRYTPWSKAEYKKACLLLSSGRELDDITRAWAFYVAQYMSMKKSYYSDPQGENFGYKSKVGAGELCYRTFTHRVRRLVENAQKLRQCQIMNDDGIDVMKRFDGKDVFMFVDPPYLSTTVRSKDKIYAAEYNDELHHRLLDFVQTAKSKIMLASYPNELYDKLLDCGWVRIDKMKCISAGHYTSKRRKQTRRIESLYLNYQPPASCPIVGTTPLLTS